MHSIMLNGEAVSPKDMSRLRMALASPEIVTEKGGYLFKSRMDSSTFHFGVLPNFLNGERAYHYNIDIGPSVFNLIGSINANCTLTVLLKLDREKIAQPLSEAERAEYRRQYACLARFLIDCGLPTSFPLDSISTEVVRETQLCGKAAINLGQLAALQKMPSRDESGGQIPCGG